MLSDGLYSLDYGSSADAAGYAGSGLAVLRAGRVLGTDQRGGVFFGEHRYDTTRSADIVALRMRVPPEGELVTGFAAGAGGATIDIVAAIEPSGARAEMSVDVGGSPVSIRLTFIGQLPH